MNSLNKAMIIGNVTRDPEARATATGQNISSFGVATNRAWKDQQGQKQERVDFHNVVAWGKLAEICNQYLKKGKKVFIEGRLQTNDWTGQDGVKRYRTEIIAENMQMLSFDNNYNNNQSISGPVSANQAPVNNFTPSVAPSPVAPAPVSSSSVPEEEVPIINQDDSGEVIGNPDVNNFNEEANDDEINVEHIPF